MSFPPLKTLQPITSSFRVKSTPWFRGSASHLFLSRSLSPTLLSAPSPYSALSSFLCSEHAQYFALLPLPWLRGSTLCFHPAFPVLPKQDRNPPPTPHPNPAPPALSAYLFPSALPHLLFLSVPYHYLPCHIASFISLGPVPLVCKFFEGRNLASFVYFDVPRFPMPGIL